MGLVHVGHIRWRTKFLRFSWEAYTQWEPLDKGGLLALQQAMVEDGYRLVIIDTLSRALSAKPDQNSVGDMTRALGMLQHLALEQGAMIGVIDHHTKPRGTHPDPVDDILGSTGKGAVADVVAGLYRERGKRGATLHIVGRDLDADQKLALEWDPALAGWRYLGPADDVRKASLQADILTALDDLGGEATTSELAEHLGKQKGTISHELVELVKKNKVIACERRGKEQPYRLIR